MALLLTLLSGLFFLIGIFVYKIVPNKIAFSRISFSCACIIIFGLISFDIMPELVMSKSIFPFIFIPFGLIFLALIDKLIPAHKHNHHDKCEEEKEHIKHIEHISTITMLALLFHNIIEGMALYGVAINNIKASFIMLIGIGLHNMPFGFQIAPSLKNKKNITLVILLVLSTFIGGLIFYLFGSLNNTLEIIILSLTCGMLLHILLFELLTEVYKEIKRKETIYGIIIGIIILIIINYL